MDPLSSNELEIQKNAKKEFTDAFNFCWDLLKVNDYYVSATTSDTISRKSTIYGQKMYSKILEIIEEMLKNNDNVKHINKTRKTVNIEFVKVEENFDDLNGSNDYNSEIIGESAIDTLRDAEMSHDLLELPGEEKRITNDEPPPLAPIRPIITIGKKLSINYDNDPITSAAIVKPDSYNNTEDDDEDNDDDDEDEEDDEEDDDDDVDYVDEDYNTDDLMEIDNPHDDEDDDENDNDNVDENDEKNKNKKDLDEDNKETIEPVKKKRKREYKKIVGKRKKSYISCEVRKEAVKLSLKNPTMTLKEIERLSGCKNIKSRKQLEIWAEQVTKGGTYLDKYKAINGFVYGKCLEYKNTGRQLDNRTLRKWGLEAEKICLPNAKLNSRFLASDKWLLNFKKSHGIAGPPLKLYWLDQGSSEGDQCLDPAQSEEKKPVEDVDEITLEKRLSLNSLPTPPPNIKRKMYAEEQKKIFVPHEEKARIVKLVRRNPNWTIEMVREHAGGTYIKNRKQLIAWAAQVDNTGSVQEIRKRINNWVFSKCVENKKKNEKITNKMIADLREEAKIVLKIDPNFKHAATPGWLFRFKQNYNITGDQMDLEFDVNSPLLQIDNPANYESEENENNSIENWDNENIDDVELDKVEYFPRSRAKKIFVPYEEKVRVVNMIREHPNWSLKTLQQESGCKFLRSRQQLEKWQDQVFNGGSREDQLNAINNWVFCRCVESKKNNEKISNSRIREWGLEAKEALMYTAMKFGATQNWMYDFKRKNNITGEPFDLNIGN